MKKLIYDEKTGLVTKVQTVGFKPTNTQQQFKEQCDVNRIMDKYKKTGEITHLNKKTGVYLDSVSIPTYQEALHLLNEASESFSSLPAHVRKYFSNDPQELIQFLSDSSNDEEAIRLGLKNAPAAINDDQALPKNDESNRQKKGKQQSHDEAATQKPE